MAISPSAPKTEGLKRTHKRGKRSPEAKIQSVEACGNVPAHVKLTLVDNGAQVCCLHMHPKEAAEFGDALLEHALLLMSPQSSC